ncbi:MAG: hypothetical protein V1746_00560 [bacterium]
MLYAVQMVDGRERVTAIISANDDREAAVLAEQWRECLEWDVSMAWGPVKIWRLGPQVSRRVRIRSNGDAVSKVLQKWRGQEPEHVFNPPDKTPVFPVRAGDF